MFAITTSTSTRPVVASATEAVTSANLIAAIHGGKVRFAKVRETGTLRSWPVLVPGSPAHSQAQQVLQARAAKQPVEAIAKEHGVSVPTIRRLITAAAFTAEVEGWNATERKLLADALTKGVKEEAAKGEPKAPAKAAPAKATPAKKETKAARLQRMQAEGKAAKKSPSQN